MSYNQRRTLSNTSWGLILFHKFSLVILFSCKKGLPLCCFGGGGLRKRICPPPPRWQKWHNFLNAVLSIIVLKLFQHLSDARTRKISWTLKVATQAYLYFLRPIAPSSPSSRWTKSFHWGRGGGIRQLQHFSLKGKQGRCNIFSMAERQKWKEMKGKEEKGKDPGFLWRFWARILQPPCQHPARPSPLNTFVRIHNNKRSNILKCVHL